MLVTPGSSAAQSSCVSPKDPFLNPFNRDSAHHRPIGTGARYADENHPASRSWLRADRLGISVGGPWGVDAVTVTGSDPTVRIAATGSGTGLPASIRLPRGGLQTNIGFNAFGTTDGVAIIHDRSDGRTHELFQYRWNGGSPNASILRNWDIRGLGHGTAPGQRLGTSATGVAMLFGILRGYEINQAGRPIEHALQIVLPRKHLPNQRCNIMISRDRILPATTRDRTADQSGENTGEIPYGAVMAIPRYVDVSRLGLSDPGLRLARAIQNYGMYVVDGGGCANGAIRADQAVSDSVKSQIMRDMPKIYREVRMVLNSAWTPGQAAVGGGQPIAPNCAFDAGATNVASVQQSSGATSQSTTAKSPSPQPQSTSGRQSSSQNQTASTSSNRAPAPGTSAAANWQKAKQFYGWAMGDKRAMAQTRPGTPEHQRAKANFERNSRNYVEHAARAGIRVTIDIPPEQAVSSAATGSSSALASSGQSAVPQTGSVRPPSEQPATSTAANKEPRPGTSAAANWEKAKQFYRWAMMGKNAMAVYRPGTQEYRHAQETYARNSRNYVEHAARAGIKVTIDIPPEKAFG